MTGPAEVLVNFSISITLKSNSWRRKNPPEQSLLGILFLAKTILNGQEYGPPMHEVFVQDEVFTSIVEKPENVFVRRFPKTAPIAKSLAVAHKLQRGRSQFGSINDWRFRKLSINVWKAQNESKSSGKDAMEYSSSRNVSIGLGYFLRNPE
ncbi:hypothetical protein Tco_0732150 [Tanacetum coccineum]